VTYREFDGGHAVTPEVALEAVAWATGSVQERSGRRLQ
jgi:hypothetical protein